MAKVIEHQFRQSQPRKNERYPWTEWADGKTRELRQGEDFSRDPWVVYNAAKSYGQRRGLMLRGEVRGDRLIIQFVPAEQPRQSERPRKTAAKKPRL
jgi:hypothetical protein